MDSSEEPRYPSLSLVDVLVLFSHFAMRVWQDIPFSIILKTIIILILYLPILLFETLSDLQRSNNPVILTLKQRVTIKLVRLVFGTVDYRVSRVFCSPAACLPLIKRKFGGNDAFDMFCAPVDTVVDGGTLRGWWLARSGHAQYLAQGRCPPDVEADGKKIPWTMCYFHGGGFVMGSPEFYLHFLHELRLTFARSDAMRDASIFVPFYPLAPESRYSAQAYAARRAWIYLNTHPAVDTSQLVVGGDSAGGNIALGLQMSIHLEKTQSKSGLYQGLSSPSQMILLSPFTTLSESMDQSSSLYRNAPYDLIEIGSLSRFAQLRSGARLSLYGSNITEFLADKFNSTLTKSIPSALNPFKRVVSPLTSDSREEEIKLLHNNLCQSNPLLSPGDHTHLLKSALASCSTLVLYGTGEILADQAKATLGLGVDLVSRPSIHVWPMILFLLGKDVEERSSGLREISRWIIAHSSVRGS